MNLIYIWFYDYKCFKERGINLMPDKYSIDVIDFGTNFLELKIDKKIWIPSPLQTKVRDVYAIISKNGKGKSTLLDVMTNENEYCYELFDSKYVDGDYVVIYEDEGYYYYNIKVTQIPYHYFCVTINNKGSCRFLKNYTSQYITKDVIMIQPNQDRVKYVDLLHFILERKDELGVHGDCRLVFLINDKEDSQSYIVKDIKKLLFKRFCKISCSNMSKEMKDDYYKVLSANENEFDSLYSLFLKKYKNNIYLYKGLIDNFINIINIINILGTDIFEILDEGIGIKISTIQSFTQKNYDIFKYLLSIFNGNLNYLRRFCEISIEGISSGQEAFLYLNTAIYTQIHEYFDIIERDDHFILCIDEPEKGFHPDWSRRLVENIIDLVESMECEVSYTIYITTHAPFVLSDIKNDHVISLDNDIKISTYGADILQILDNGFFLESVIGSYAKKELQYIHKMLSTCLSIEEVKEKTGLDSIQMSHYIESIGNDLVRSQMLRLWKFILLKNKQLNLEGLENDQNKI